MSRQRKFTQDELVALAGSAVAKIDIHGPRGVTYVSEREIEAMATLIVMADVLPGDLGEPHRKARFAQVEERA